MFPWADDDEYDYLVLGKGFNAYPIAAHDLSWEILNKTSDPKYVIEWEIDGIYLLSRVAQGHPARLINRVAESAIKLERVEVALEDEQRFFWPVGLESVSVAKGQTIRVSLYWEALAAPGAERTVSIRVEDGAGNIFAQEDALPGKSSRPTSWWQPGWYFRDIYYLTISPDAALGPASLDLLLYDTYSQERVPFGEDEILYLVALDIALPE